MNMYTTLTRTFMYAEVLVRCLPVPRPFTQKGEIQENMSLETAAKRLLPRNYGDHYSIAVLERLKA